MKCEDGLWLILTILAMAGVVWFTVHSYIECANTGGTIVQGIVWHECIK